jgi:hypothetical protein
MASSKVCNCNALTVPHVHDARGITAATDAEKKADSGNAGATPTRFNTSVK